MKKINITPKSEFAIKIFCLLILIFLNLAIWYNGKNLTCDNCSIDFTASRRERTGISNKVYQNFSVRIKDLYEGFLEDYCLIEFDKLQGYYLKNDTRIE